MEGLMHKVELINEFGEQMILGLDNKKQGWFYHEDCTTKYEKVEDLFLNYKLKRKKNVIKGFKYVFSQMEKAVLIQFFTEHGIKAPDDVKTINV